MSTNQIFEKVAALQMEKQDKQPDKKKSGNGAWEEVECLQDKDSGIGVSITQRIRGKPAYSITVLHFDGDRAQKHIQMPCLGKHLIEDIVHALVKRAREVVEERVQRDLAASNAGRARPSQAEKPNRKAPPVGGLSDLARKDAESHGKVFVGKTARKKSRKS